ncbi:MAG: hypothetical protein ACAI35_05730 [Candidatus Methylacidiphilales bacterium]|nr:hypothetical protein [Candidatus Methylacidiphilales bacterium]
MSHYFHIEPEVAGARGEQTIADRSAHPPVISRLHYDFAGWLGDQLLTTFSSFIATEELFTILEGQKFTGFEKRAVIVTTNEQFRNLYPDRVLPQFHWLYITGRPGVNDLGLANDCDLIVSEAALKAIKPLCPHDLEVSEYPA